MKSPAERGTIGEQPRSPGTRVASALGLLLLILVAAWSAFWVFARWQAQQGLTTFLANEQAHGRIWTCPDQSINGYPFAIKIRCDQPTFAEVNNAGFAGELGALKATTLLYHPTSVEVDLTGPLVVHDRGAEGRIVVNWSRARLMMQNLVPGPIAEAHLQANDVELAAGPGRSPTRIGTATLQYAPVAPDSASLATDLADLRDPDANAVFGGNEPIIVAFKGVVSGLPREGASLPTLLAQWHQAGGVLDVARFALTKGGFQAQGSGRLQLDDERRVAGRLDSHFSGLEPLAGRFGIPVAAVKVGGLLSSLLGGKPADTPAAGAETLDLPIVLRDGRLYIGPAKTGLKLLPLY